MVEMLFSSSLVAVVGAGQQVNLCFHLEIVQGSAGNVFMSNDLLLQPALSPRRLSVFNTITNTISAELNFVSSILCVRMNRKRYSHSFAFQLLENHH